MERIEIGTYEDLRDTLRVRLVDMKSGAEALRNTVYEPVGCGYALAAYIELPEHIAEHGIANFPRSLAAESGTDPKRILEDALAGSLAHDPPKLCPVNDMLFGDAGGNLLEGGEMAEDSMFLVMTTEDGILGAAALYYPDIQKRICEIVGGDYYVLPSSVHEVLILPDNGEADPKALAKMVGEINATQVSPAERLGDRVLHYRGDIGRMQVAADLDKIRDREKERG